MSTFQIDLMDSIPITVAAEHRKIRDVQRKLKSYTKDRRAYEYWSDGNIHGQPIYGSPFFNNISADHIGPISLGFVHDQDIYNP